MDEAVTTYLGLGANTGDRRGNLARALEYIQNRGELTVVSSVYESEPVGYREQPLFLNMACGLKTDLSPNELFRYMKLIEILLGRKPSFRNAPRPIDIDVLVYGDRVIREKGLVIPHPRMHERAFVMAPMADIAPDLVHPEFQKTMKRIAEEIGTEGVKLVDPGIP